MMFGHFVSVFLVLTLLLSLSVFSLSVLWCLGGAELAAWMDPTQDNHSNRAIVRWIWRIDDYV